MPHIYACGVAAGSASDHPARTELSWAPDPDGGLRCYGLHIEGAREPAASSLRFVLKL
jgi:hypothetical protein